MVFRTLRSDAKFHVNFSVTVLFWETEVRSRKALNEKLRGHPHRISALTLTLMLALILEKNMLVSIASFTPIINISVNTKTNINTLGVNTA